jgi:hypothetical protein
VVVKVIMPSPRFAFITGRILNSAPVGADPGMGASDAKTLGAQVAQVLIVQRGGLCSIRVNGALANAFPGGDFPLVAGMQVTVLPMRDGSGDYTILGYA